VLGVSIVNAFLATGDSKQILEIFRTTRADGTISFSISYLLDEGVSSN